MLGSDTWRLDIHALKGLMCSNKSQQRLVKSAIAIRAREYQKGSNQSGKRWEGFSKGVMSSWTWKDDSSDQVTKLRGEVQQPQDQLTLQKGSASLPSFALNILLYWESMPVWTSVQLQSSTVQILDTKKTVFVRSTPAAHTGSASAPLCLTSATTASTSWAPQCSAAREMAHGTVPAPSVSVSICHLLKMTDGVAHVKEQSSPLCMCVCVCVRAHVCVALW